MAEKLFVGKLEPAESLLPSQPIAFPLNEICSQQIDPQ